MTCETGRTETKSPDPPVPSGVNSLPNAMKNAGEATPFPSSNHPGVVNLAMCDGSVKSLTNEIDCVVYLRLWTPAETRRRFVGFVPEDPVNEAED